MASFMRRLPVGNRTMLIALLLLVKLPWASRAQRARCPVLSGITSAEVERKGIGLPGKCQVRQSNSSEPIHVPIVNPAKADIIIAIDTSGSMAEETKQVMDNINLFGQYLEVEGIDYRVVLVGESSTCCSLCVKPPLAPTDCALEGPRFRQVTRSIDSFNMLAILSDGLGGRGVEAGEDYDLTAYEDLICNSGDSTVANPVRGICKPRSQASSGEIAASDAAGLTQLGYASFLRPEASKTFVIVTDDANTRYFSEKQNCAVLAGANTFNKDSPCVNDFIDTVHAFDIGLSDPAIFNKTKRQPEGFVFHTIDGNDCPAAPGYQRSWLYNKLAERTGGSKFKLCNSDWTGYFVDIANAVRDSLDTPETKYEVPRDISDPDNYLFDRMPLNTPFDIVYSYRTIGEDATPGINTTTFVRMIDNECPDKADYTTLQDRFVNSVCPSLQNSPLGFFKVDNIADPKLAYLCEESRDLVTKLPPLIGSRIFKFKSRGVYAPLSVSGLGAKATAAMIEYGFIEDYRGQSVRKAQATAIGVGQSVEDFYRLTPSASSLGPVNGTGASGLFADPSLMFNASRGKGLALFFYADAQDKTWFGFQFGGGSPTTVSFSKIKVSEDEGGKIAVVMYDVSTLGASDDVKDYVIKVNDMVRIRGLSKSPALNGVWTVIASNKISFTFDPSEVNSDELPRAPTPIRTYDEAGTATVMPVLGSMQMSVTMSGAAAEQEPGPKWRVQNGDAFSLRYDWNTKAGGFYPSKNYSRVEARAMLPSNTSGGMLGPLPSDGFCLDLEIIEYSRIIDHVTLVNFVNLNGTYDVDITHKNSILLKKFTDVQLRPGFRVCTNSCEDDIGTNLILCRMLRNGSTSCHTPEDVDNAAKTLQKDYGYIFNSSSSDDEDDDEDENNITGFILGPSGSPPVDPEGNVPNISDGSGGSNGNENDVFSRYAWLWAILIVFLIGLSCCCGVAAVFINSDDDDDRPCFHCIMRATARLACCHVLEKWAAAKLPSSKNRRKIGASVEMTNRRGGHHRRHLSEGSNFWTPPSPSERNNGVGSGLRKSRLIMSKDNPVGTYNPLMPIANTMTPVSKKRFSSAASKNRDNRKKKHARERSKHIMSPGFRHVSAQQNVKRFSNFEKFARHRGVKIDIILCNNVGETGWILYDSHEHQAEYYHNSDTGETQWTCPSDVEDALPPSSSPAGAGAVADPTIGEWIQLFDSDFHLFYCNSKSGRLEWNLPAGGRARESTRSVQKTTVNPLSSTMQMDSIMEVQMPEMEMDVQPETAAAMEMKGIDEVSVTKHSSSSTWTMFETEDGVTAYFNEETEETRWTNPAGDISSDNAVVTTEARLGSGSKRTKMRSMKFVHSSKLAKLEKQFSEYQTKDGEIAFYNAETGEAAWENPNKACSNYRPDLSAKQFNVCKCGFEKKSHKL